MNRKTIAILTAIVALSLPAGVQTPSYALTTYSFRPVLVVAGLTPPMGVLIDPMTHVQLPNLTFISLFIAKETTLGFGYGKFVISDTTASTLSSATITVNWSDITASSATFRFRVLYRIVTDQAVCSIVHENAVVNPDPNIAHPERWRFDVSYWNYTLTTRYGSLPTFYLPPEAVTLTP